MSPPLSENEVVRYVANASLEQNRAVVGQSLAREIGAETVSSVRIEKHLRGENTHTERVSRLGQPERDIIVEWHTAMPGPVQRRAMAGAASEGGWSAATCMGYVSNVRTSIDVESKARKRFSGPSQLPRFT